MKNKSAIRQYGKRNRILKESGFSGYQDFLKSPAWQQSKARIEQKIKKGRLIYSDCFCCHTRENLQLHHLKYNKLNLSGGVGSYLKYVCGNCHENIHTIVNISQGISIKIATLIWKRWRESRHIKPSHRRLLGPGANLLK